MLKPLIAATLLAAATTVLAQGTTPAPDADKGKKREEFREKMQEKMKAARDACKDKQGDDRRACMTQQLCADAKDQDKCKARIE
ncbi:MAG: hypothetical protein JO035_02270, partial [Betaproteobacteria bacterium]|nr:hypothetical protein [Betaproteobacteria bacterium]